MAEGTSARLDTVDTAFEYGWQVESAYETDVFTKAAITIEVRYSSNDDIESVLKRDAAGGFDSVGEHAVSKHKVLRAWLAGRNDYQKQTVPMIEASRV